MRPKVEAISIWLEIEEFVFMIELLDCGIKHWSELGGHDKLTKVGLREATRRAMALQQKLQVRLSAYRDAEEPHEK